MISFGKTTFFSREMGLLHYYIMEQVSHPHCLPNYVTGTIQKDYTTFRRTVNKINNKFATILANSVRKRFTQAIKHHVCNTSKLHVQESTLLHCIADLGINKLSREHVFHNSSVLACTTPSNYNRPAENCINPVNEHLNNAQLNVTSNLHAVHKLPLVHIAPQTNSAPFQFGKFENNTLDGKFSKIKGSISVTVRI